MATVLIVDDDPEVVGLARVALGIAGHEVVCTTDLARVVPLAAAVRARAVVLDLVLPGYSGYDAFRALKQDPRTASVPVLILSGLASGADRVRGLTEGADDYLTKPFMPLELVARVERLLRPPGVAVSAPAGPELEQQLAAVEARLAAGEEVQGLGIARYALSGVLGEGGMGVVVRGWDPRLQRAVALKLLRVQDVPRDADPGERVHRLLLEAILVAQISHPHVVAVHDVGESARGGYVAMELVEGTTLEALLAEGRRLPASLAVPLVGALLRGLEAAHRRGLVHHDVKPGNTLLGREGAVKLTDFGVAALLSSWVRHDDMLYGTPGYVPPETIRGGAFDARGDLFSAGVVLYQCLAGRLPFGGRTVEEMLVRTVYQEPAPLAPTLQVRPELEALVRTLLAKDPGRRPASAAEAADRLDALCGRYGWRWSWPESLPAPPREPRRAELLPTTERVRSRLLPALRARPAWA